jgi:hypothetical protein
MDNPLYAEEYDFLFDSVDFYSRKTFDFLMAERFKLHHELRVEYDGQNKKERLRSEYTDTVVQKGFFDRLECQFLGLETLRFFAEQ